MQRIQHSKEAIHPQMTTSRGPSARMFSLHRRQSALNLPSLGSGASDSTASTSNSSADASIVRSVQSPLTSSSLIGEDQEGESQDQEPSPTCRQSSKDKASKSRPQKNPAIPTRSSTGRNVVTTKSPTAAAEPTRSTQARDPECVHLRSPQSNPTGHERTLSRDFVLPTSYVRHENCSSLKDQFLKIKERFSPSSPPRSSAATASVSPLTVETPPSFSSAAATATTHSTSTETSDRVTEAADLQAESTETLGEQHERQEQSADESNWELPQARVERWYREDDFFKACITCWTMEAGAAIVSRVAHVVSEWPADSSSRSNTGSSGASASGSNSIHPDVSLQWIGRQLWAVTVSLPLTRSGELHEEHIALAHRINQAVAEVSKRSKTLTVLPDAIAVAGEAQHLQATLSIAMHQERDAVPASGSDEKKASTELQSLPSTELGRDSDVDASQEPVVRHLSSPFSTLAAEEVETLRLSQPQLAGEEHIHGEKDATSDNPEGEASRREDEEAAEKDQDDQVDQDEEDGDGRVAALPLSWSMLSLSSQPSGSSEHASTSLHGEFPITDDDSASDAATNIAPEKTGWLKKKKRKQHGLGSSWQQRYFELKGNRLYYFASEADGLPRGAVLLDHALVQRGSGDHAMAFSISSASSHRRLQILKFSARLTHHVYPRKSIELRVMEETDSAVIDWVAALNRASFYCKLASASAGCSATLPAPSSSSSFGPFSTPDRKRKTPFYRFRSPSATKATLATASQSLSAEKERRDVEIAEAEELWTTTARWTASYQQLGSVQYLRETDPLLWEVHPPEQIAIRKKAARARTRSDYLAIFTRHAETFAQIFLPRPQPISLEQTLRDILPELFLINDTLYGGGEQQQQQQQATEQGQSDSSQQQSRGLEHIFEVLDAHIQRFAAAPEERVRAVSALLQACARTISGGDSYFVVHRLLGNPNLIIRPAEARGRPIEIDVSPERPSHFLITVFSAFSFHHVDDVERFGDSSDANGGGMTPAPLLRVRTRHIQEFDFASGTSSRWLRVHMEGRKEDSGSGSGGGAGGGSLGRWGSRRQSHEVAESRIGALLDALS